MRCEREREKDKKEEMLWVASEKRETREKEGCVVVIMLVNDLRNPSTTSGTEKEEVGVLE